MIEIGVEDPELPIFDFWKSEQVQFLDLEHFPP